MDLIEDYIHLRSVNRGIKNLVCALMSCDRLLVLRADLQERHAVV